MGKLLVLAVDRDDDFGTKAGVSTPLIGVERCREAATALGMADPEDSDTNALFSAIKVCLDLRKEGTDAEVALICGASQVGIKSDMAISDEFEAVKKRVKPEGLILVGDGAEDEYIYPLLSGVKIVTTKRVYVKQAPGLEGNLYIITKMLADPDKRRRFVAPIGVFLVLVSLFFVLPNVVMYISDPDISGIARMSSGLAVLAAGLVLILYGYSVGKRLKKLKARVYNNMFKESTKLLFLAVAVAFLVISAVYDYLEIQNMYFQNEIPKVIFFVESLIWPMVISLMLYIAGNIIADYQNERVFRTSYAISGLTLAAYALVATGSLDVLMTYIGYWHMLDIGILEVAAGIALTLVVNFLVGRVKRDKQSKKRSIIRRKGRKSKDDDLGEEYDAVYRVGACVRGDPLRHGLLPLRRRGLREGPALGDPQRRPGFRRRGRVPRKGVLHRFR